MFISGFTNTFCLFHLWYKALNKRCFMFEKKKKSLHSQSVNYTKQLSGNLVSADILSQDLHEVL